MNILVLMRMVPDVVEELEVAADGKSLDTEFLRMIVNESDDHALEEALILKERHGGKVTVVALEAPEVDDALFNALAKGADRALKIVGAEGRPSTALAAKIFSETMRGVAGLMPADLILTGTQAIDDLDGLIAPLVSHHLDLPFIGIVTTVAVDSAANVVTAAREFPNSVRGEFEAPLPAVLGIQAAEKPPRYVPVAKVRAMMKSAKLETAPVPEIAADGESFAEVLQMAKPVSAGHAEMIGGTAEEAAEKVCEILAAAGRL